MGLITKKNTFPGSGPGPGAAGSPDASEPDRIVWSSCSVNCGSRCPLRVHVKDGVVVRVETDAGPEDVPGAHQIRACLRGPGHAGVALLAGPAQAPAQAGRPPGRGFVRADLLGRSPGYDRRLAEADHRPIRQRSGYHALRHRQPGRHGQPAGADRAVDEPGRGDAPLLQLLLDRPDHPRHEVHLRRPVRQPHHRPGQLQAGRPVRQQPGRDQDERRRNGPGHHRGPPTRAGSKPLSSTPATPTRPPCWPTSGFLSGRGPTPPWPRPWLM